MSNSTYRIMEKGTDPFTGEVFTKKRSNQVFATRENQIHYNNRKAGEKRKAKAVIDRKLDKNRTILRNLLGDKREITKSLDFLRGAGFDFFCQTHNYVKDGKKFSCIYEFAFVLVGDNKIKIFRHG